MHWIESIASVWDIHRPIIVHSNYQHVQQTLQQHTCYAWSL